MGLFSKKPPIEPPPVETNESTEKTPEGDLGVTKPTESNQETISKDFQTGVQNVEAVAMIWTRSHMITAYGM
jgi:hypothetical protein